MTFEEKLQAIESKLTDVPALHLHASRIIAYRKERYIGVAHREIEHAIMELDLYKKSESINDLSNAILSAINCLETARNRIDVLLAQREIVDELYASLAVVEEIDPK